MREDNSVALTLEFQQLLRKIDVHAVRQPDGFVLRRTRSSEIYARTYHRLISRFPRKLQTSPVAVSLRETCARRTATRLQQRHAHGFYRCFAVEPYGERKGTLV